MRQVETDQFRTPQRAGKAEQQACAVAQTGEVGAAGLCFGAPTASILRHLSAHHAAF